MHIQTLYGQTIRVVSFGNYAAWYCYMQVPYETAIGSDPWRETPTTNMITSNPTLLVSTVKANTKREKGTSNNRQDTKKYCTMTDCKKFEFKTDREWKEAHGNIPPLLFQTMAAGWEEKINVDSACRAGGLHSLEAPFIETVHVLFFSRLRPKSIYFAKGLHTTPHYNHHSFEEVRSRVSELNKRSDVSIQLKVYMPHRSYTTGEVLFVNERTDEWDLVSEMYKMLRLRSMANMMYGMDLARSDRGNKQLGFGFTSYGHSESADPTKPWRPSIRKDTDAKKVNDLCLLTDIMRVIVEDDLFNNSDRTKEVAELALKAGVPELAERLRLEALTFCVADAVAIVLKHCDRKNDSRESYQWVVVANLVYKDSRGWKRASKIGYTRDLMGRFVDKVSVIDKAVGDFGVYIKSVDSNRTNFGTHLLNTRPSTGYCGVDPHLDKVTGLYGLYASEMNRKFKEYARRATGGSSLPTTKRIEIIYGAMATNKPMQFCKALSHLTMGDLRGTKCLTLRLFEEYRKIGGNSGGLYPRFQCSFNRAISDVQLCSSLNAILEAVHKMRRHPATPHADLVEYLAKNVHGAQGFLAHHLHLPNRNGGETFHGQHGYNQRRDSVCNSHRKRVWDNHKEPKGSSNQGNHKKIQHYGGCCRKWFL